MCDEKNSVWRMTDSSVEIRKSFLISSQVLYLKVIFLSTSHSYLPV